MKQGAVTHYIIGLACVNKYLMKTTYLDASIHLSCVNVILRI